MADKPTLTDWVLRRWRARYERRLTAEASARQLLAAGGRSHALHAVHALRNAAHSDPLARREAEALQDAIDRLSPAPKRPPRSDTATRMLYRDD